MSIINQFKKTRIGVSLDQCRAVDVETVGNMLHLYRAFYRQIRPRTGRQRIAKTDVDGHGAVANTRVGTNDFPGSLAIECVHTNEEADSNVLRLYLVNLEHGLERVGLS